MAQKPTQIPVPRAVNYTLYLRSQGYEPRVQDPTTEFPQFTATYTILNTATGQNETITATAEERDTAVESAAYLAYLALARNIYQAATIESAPVSYESPPYAGPTVASSSYGQAESSASGSEIRKSGSTNTSNTWSAKLNEYFLQHFKGFPIPMVVINGDEQNGYTAQYWVGSKALGHMGKGSTENEAKNNAAWSALNASRYFQYP